RPASASFKMLMICSSVNRFFIAVPLWNGLYTVTVLNAGSRSGLLFAIVSGSGNVQATRYSYRIKGGKLAVVGATTFTPVDDAYDISFMTCASDFRCREVGGLKDIPAKQAQKCMGGIDDCNYRN
ncbi:hypothetical protein, partial [Burkholderia sp. Ac-20384]|uniref:hypothetical protein n=1 Tax=Burkholderia sp. Ac-20384 TaxID=2703902 RepID=UPI00197D05C9